MNDPGRMRLRGAGRGGVRRGLAALFVISALGGSVASEPPRCTPTLSAVPAVRPAGSIQRTPPGHLPLPGAELFHDGALHAVDVTVRPGDLQALRDRPREYVQAEVRFGTEVIPSVAVRLKGSVGSFRDVDDRPSLTLDFAKYNPRARFRELRRVQVNNAVEDPGWLHEWLAAEVFRTAGVPAPRVAHARVSLNGRPLGVYVLKEGFTPEFLAAHFSDPTGALYDDDLGHDVDEPLHLAEGPSAGAPGARLQALLEATREPDQPTRWRRLGEVLDIGRFLTFMAMETVLGHRDGYTVARNNFRLYHDPATDRFVFLPDGCDQLLGEAAFPWCPHPGGRVARAVLEAPEGRRLYRAEVIRALDEVFDPGRWTQRLQAKVAALSPALSREERTGFRSRAEDLRRRLIAHERELRRQLADAGPTVPVFADGSVRLDADEWTAADGPAGGVMDRQRGPDGRSCLYIRAGPVTGAAWRSRVLLPRGAYQFSGRARVQGVEPRVGSRQPGAGLRVGGRPRSGNSLRGDSDWVPLVTTFTVAADTEVVELLGELNACKGELWIELDSLQLSRLSDSIAAFPTLDP